MISRDQVPTSKEIDILRGLNTHSSEGGKPFLLTV